MSYNLIIFILSLIAFAVLNNRFLKNDYEYQRQSKEFSLLSDPLGIRRFKQQPTKMAALMAVLFGPIGIYNLILTLTAG
ncbi:hypothetical protein A9Q96_12145 [Rhodobacterales bacterium 52_120_T64]|nr:hypothetical protein A9Q96_12145 [Rhodobacterales bacterium 52_120_T64]